MQVLCFAFIYTSKDTHTNQEVSHDVVLNILLIRHFIAYICHAFRNYDITAHGKVDRFGVLRGTAESILQVFEVFYDCVIFGYVLKHMLVMTEEEFQ